MKFDIVDLTADADDCTAQDVRDAVEYVLTEVTLRKRPLDEDPKMQRALDVLGESLFTKVWGFASAVSGRSERQAQNSRYTVPTLDSDEWS